MADALVAGERRSIVSSNAAMYAPPDAQFARSRFVSSRTGSRDRETQYWTREVSSSSPTPNVAGCGLPGIPTTMRRYTDSGSRPP